MPFFFSSDVVVSTQKTTDLDDLNPCSLDAVFMNLTSDTSDMDKTVTAISRRRKTSRFVDNSGLVPYDSSSESSDVESFDSIDVVNQSRPDSPIFKCVPHPETSSEKPSRFKTATSKQDLQDLAGKSFARSTDRKINWAVNLFRMWCQNRIDEGTGEGKISWYNIDHDDLDPEVLAHVLPTFINEIKRMDGQDYPPNTVYSIIVMIQLFLEKKGRTWKLLDGPMFNSVRNMVDNIMKHWSMARIAQKVKRSEPISITDKEEMWDFGVLGEENPDSLRSMVMYLIGLTFALRGGKEHRTLRNPHFDPQIVVKTSEKSRLKYLLYTEDIVTKTNQGGLSGRKLTPKVIKAFGNPNPQRDLVCLYQKYVSLCPPEPKSDALYKYSLCESNRRPCQWYSDKPLGINSIAKTVGNLMKQAGKSGNFTNHCLRVTAVTRMFEGGIKEQLVKEKTGHKSDAVRMYKRTSDNLMEQAERAVVCPNVDRTLVPTNQKEFDIDDDISSFDLFCTKKYPKSTHKCCSNSLCEMFGNCVKGKKVKKLKVLVEFAN